MSDLGNVGQRPNGQLLQDALVVGLFGRGGYFIEVGAGHPRRFSNTYVLDRYLEWSGVRIEPNPEFAALHRADLSGGVTFFEVVASGDTDGWCDLILAEELSVVSHQAPKDGYARERQQSEARNGSIRVRTRPISDLLFEASSPSRVEYLSIDTEGSELELLMAFPFDVIEVQFLTVEHNHNKSAQRQQCEFLFDKGFQQVFEPFTAWESWFVSSTLLDGRA